MNLFGLIKRGSGKQADTPTVPLVPSSAPPIDPNSVVHWASQYFTVDDLIDKAMSTFYLAADKEISAAAAYKALGLDPRDAPKFGWGLMSRPTNSSINQTIGAASPPSAPVTSGGGVGNLLKGALLGAGLLAGGAAMASLMAAHGNMAPIGKVIDQTKDLNVTGKVLYEPPQ